MIRYITIFILLYILTYLLLIRTKNSIIIKSDRINLLSKVYSFNPCIFTHNNKIYITHRVLKYNDTYSYLYINDKLINLPKLNEYGYEDARCVTLNNFLYILINAYIPPKNIMSMVKIPLIELENNDPISPIPIFFKSSKPREKNWMPFNYNNELHAVYSVNPHTILKINDDGTYNKVYETFNENLPTNISGGTNIIKINNMYLGIVHIHRNKYYTHMFYTFECNPPFKINYISDEFIISSNNIKFINNSFLLKYFINIQFISGIQLINDILYITYGENDTSSNIMYVPLSSLTFMQF